MATSMASDFLIYQEQFQTGFLEKMTQNANLFNGASNGAIRLVTRMIKGHIEQGAFFKKLSTIAYRDINADTAITAAKMVQGEQVGVKINRSSFAATTYDAFKKLGKSPDEFMYLYGQSYADEMVHDQLNTGLLALTTALSKVATIGFDATAGATKTLTVNNLMGGLATRGDAINGIVALIMHSKQYYDLLGSQVSTAQGLVINGSSQVFTGTPATLGKPVFVTDAPALFAVGTPNTYKMLGLTAGALEIANSEQPLTRAQDQLGSSNLKMLIQSEYSYNVKVDGFSYSTAGGDINPTDTTLGTATKWSQIATDVKDLPGFWIKTQ